MYSGTNSLSGYDIGSTSAPGGAGNSCGLIVRYTFGGATYASFGGAIGNQIANSEGRGFFLGNKLGANITEIWWARAGETFVSQRTTFSQTFVRNAVNIYLAQNNPLIAGVYGGKRFQYVDFGNGLTAQQIQTHRNLVQALQQSLSRAV